MEENDFKVCTSVPSTTIRTWEDFQRLIPLNPETVVSYHDVSTIKSEILRLMLLVPVELRAENVSQLDKENTHWLFRIFGRENCLKFKHFLYDNLKISVLVFQEWKFMTPETISVWENSFVRYHPTWPSDKCSLFDFMCVALFYNQLSSTEARIRARKFSMPAYKLFFCFKNWTLDDWNAFSREHFFVGRGLRAKPKEHKSKSSESPAAARNPSVSTVANVVAAAKNYRSKLLRTNGNDVSQAQPAKSLISLYYPDGNVYIDIADHMCLLDEYVMIDVFHDCTTFSVTMETIHDHFSFIQHPSPVTLTWKNCEFFGTPARDFEVSELLLILQGKMPQTEFYTCSWEECIKKLFFDYSYLVTDYFDWVDKGKPNLVYVDTFVMVDRDDPDRFLLQNMKKDDFNDLSKHVRVMDRYGRRFPSQTETVTGKEAGAHEKEEISAYEKERRDRMKDNQKIMQELGLGDDKIEKEESSHESSENAGKKRLKQKHDEQISSRFLRSDATSLRPNDPFRNCFLSDEQAAELALVYKKHSENPIIHLLPGAASASSAVVGKRASEKGGDKAVVVTQQTSATLSSDARGGETCLNEEFKLDNWSLTASPVDESILAGDGDAQALGLESQLSSGALSSEPVASSAQLTVPSGSQQSESDTLKNSAGESTSHASVAKCSASDDNKPIQSSSMENKPESSVSAELVQKDSVSKTLVESTSAVANAESHDPKPESGLSAKAVISPAVVNEEQPADDKMQAEQEVAQAEASAQQGQEVAQAEASAQQGQLVVAEEQVQMQIESAAVVALPAALPTGDIPALLQSFQTFQVAFSNAFKTQESNASAAQARCQQQQDVLQGVSRDLTEVCSDIKWMLENMQALQGSDSSQLVLSQLDQSITEKKLAVAELDREHASKTTELKDLRDKIRQKKKEDSRLDAQQAMLDLADQRKQLEFENEKQELETKLREEFLEKERAMRAEFEEKERAMRAEFEEKERAMRADFQAQKTEMQSELSKKNLELSSVTKRCALLDQLKDVNERVIAQLKSKSVAASEVSCTTGAASGGPALAKRSDSTSSDST